MRRAWRTGSSLVGIIGALACSSGDFELKRRGGDFPTTPIPDPPSTGGTGGTGELPAAGAGDGGAPDVGPLIAFCDAIAVVEAKCQRCHGDPLTNGAPVPFVTQEDFHAVYSASGVQYWERAVRALERDFMPYVALNDPPISLMPPVEPLTVEEKATLLDWLTQGALPEGGTACP